MLQIYEHTKAKKKKKKRLLISGADLKPTVWVFFVIFWTKSKPGAPMIDMGFLMKRSRPLMPAYLLRQPADHSRTTYSVPKNSTSTISCREQTREQQRVNLLTQRWNARNTYRTRGCGGRQGTDNTGASIESKLKPLESITKIYRPTWGSSDKSVCVWGGGMQRWSKCSRTTQGERWRLITWLMTAHIKTESVSMIKKTTLRYFQIVVHLGDKLWC